MSRLEILVAGLFCGLIISLAFNVNMAWELMKSQKLYRDLSRDYDELRQSYDQLNESPSPSEPPVSKSEAIGIALEYGGWNETSLKGMVVSAALAYYCIDGGITLLHQVAGHIADFGPRTVGNATFRYLWVVAVSKKEAPSGGAGSHSIPPPGLYFVDPMTGDVTSYNDMMLGRSWLLP